MGLRYSGSRARRASWQPVIDSVDEGDSRDECGTRRMSDLSRIKGRSAVGDGAEHTGSVHVGR